MKKHARFFLVLFALLLPFVVSAAFSRDTGSQPAAPLAVPGSTLSHNVATLKTGYQFVNHEGKSVDVVRVRTSQIMGTYVCPCSKTDGGSCELIFTPTYLTCKGGSCSGATCLLTARPRLMRQ